MKKQCYFQKMWYFPFFLLLFSLVLFASPLVVKAELLPFAVEIPRDDFPVRSTAWNQAPIVTTLEKGSLLYPEDNLNGWYQVPLQDGIGYVHKDYVTVTSGKGTVSVTPGTALRQLMSQTAASYGLCSFNTEVTVTGVDSEWCKVARYGSGQSGYILTKNLSFPDKTLYSTLDITPIMFSAMEDQVKVRTGPGSNYAVIATLSPKEKVQYLLSEKTSDGALWYKIFTSGGKVGYVLSTSLKAQNSGAPLAGKVIVIDPGHGSYKTDDTTSLDEGIVTATGLKEKNVNMNIGNYLKIYLQKAGATVIMTRQGDTGVLTLTQRAEIANTRNADLFLSIHCSSNIKDTSVKGTETYYCTGNDANPVSDTVLEKRRYLAMAVQNDVVSQMGTRNRGVKTATFQVLLKTTMPSILIETAFITNSSDVKLLSSPTYQDKAANGIYRGVMKYFEKYD